MRASSQPWNFLPSAGHRNSCPGGQSPSFCCFFGDALLNPIPFHTPRRLRSPSAPLARIARFVVPGLPHHVTQRGNRRERVFFGDDDYELYRDLLASQCRKQGVACLSLLPDAEPRPPDPCPRPRRGARAGARRKTHRRYSSVVNARLRVTGHLFQSRFGSVVMDKEHLMAAARYVALNPVRAIRGAVPTPRPGLTPLPTPAA